jgi:hypothetical protein
LAKLICEEKILNFFYCKALKENLYSKALTDR